MSETCAKAPCVSCPYRRDVPSGVWAAEEYDRLLGYDGDIPEQLANGATSLFGCHQNNGKLCAGWIATHGAKNLLACRIASHRIAASVWEYASPVPVFASGREARDHGTADIPSPAIKARLAIARLERKQKRPAEAGLCRPVRARSPTRTRIPES